MAIMNLDRVNIIKREGVLNGLKQLIEVDKDKIINRVYIFGSSVREDCTEESDIDICLETDVDIHDKRLFDANCAVYSGTQDVCDILIFKCLDNNFKEKIKKKGVIVYEQ